ncbi:hypothetical protein D3C76_1284520 [compost metagenome]
MIQSRDSSCADGYQFRNDRPNSIRLAAHRNFTQSLRVVEVGHPILRDENLERYSYVPRSNSAYRLHLGHFSDHAGHKHGYSHDHTGGL